MSRCVWFLTWMSERGDHFVTHLSPISPSSPPSLHLPHLSLSPSTSPSPPISSHLPISPSLPYLPHLSPYLPISPSISPASFDSGPHVPQDDLEPRSLCFPLECWAHRQAALGLNAQLCLCKASPLPTRLHVQPMLDLLISLSMCFDQVVLGCGSKRSEAKLCVTRSHVTTAASSPIPRDGQKNLFFPLSAVKCQVSNSPTILMIFSITTFTLFILILSLLRQRLM